MIILGGKYHYYPHFTDEETEARESEVLFPMFK